jgi:DNA-binding transcriptional LysR family regulator
MLRIEKIQDLHKKLNISSVNSLGAYIMPECCSLFMEKHPDVKLVIQEYEFPEACKSILRGNTDLAFNIDSNVPESIVSIPVFSERFVLVCSQSSDYPDTVRADMLNMKKEVYVNWYTGFEDFHTSVFGKIVPQIQLDIMAQLKIFVEKPNNWAIVPISVARGLQKVSEIRTLQADFPLPERTVYCLHAKERQLEPLSVLFLQCLGQILSQTEDVKCLLNME